MPKPSASRLSHLREWSAALVEAANRTGPYPRWLIAGIKAAVVIGLLSVAAASTMDRSAKAHLAQLALEAAKGAPAKPTRHQ
jgi:hypothetical protein